MRQGWHQGLVLMSAKDVSEADHDSRLSAKLREKIGDTKPILAFAAQHGLDVGQSYSKYIYQEDPHVSHLVQAAYPDRLRSIEWWFPVVGRVPYLGFFNEEERDHESALLKQRGFDIYEGSATAFSGLGYFHDPIFTSMLERSRAGVAHLFFHELTHRTVWVKGSVRFNENLAEFVGEELTTLYLKDDADALKKYRLAREDNLLFREWLKNLRQTLSEMYRDSKLSREEKLQKKAEVFRDFTQKKSPKFATKNFSWIQSREWNNAVVLGTSLYSPDTEEFARAYQCIQPRSMNEFLRRIKEASDQGFRDENILAQLCN